MAGLNENNAAVIIEVFSLNFFLTAKYIIVIVTKSAKIAGSLYKTTFGIIFSTSKLANILNIYKYPGK